MRNILTEFMDDLREYVYESGANIAYDKRKSIEFVDIFLKCIFIVELKILSLSNIL